MALGRASIKGIRRFTTTAAQLTTKTAIQISKSAELAKVPKETLLLNSIRQNLDTLSKKTGMREPCTIFRVPEYVRNRNSCIFKPQTVSIGPYHHGAKRFQAIDRQKWRYLQDLLARDGVSVSLDVIVLKMRDLEEKVRSAYSEHVSLSSDEFVEMMVLDGCFIIEFLLKWHEKKVGSLYGGWGLSVGKSDLFLMENQIPFFVIQELYGLVFRYSEHGLLLDLLAKHMKKIDVHTPLRPETTHNNSNTIEVQNLTHLYYNWFVPKQVQTKHVGYSPTIFERYLSNSNDLELNTTEPPKVIQPVSALKEAGVKFVKKKSPRDFLDITFKDGVLEIPFTLISYNRKRVLLNLVAFEQSNNSGTDKNLTSFVKFMDMLINTPHDVEILERCDIINNMVASADEAAAFFNQISECVNLDYDKHYLAPVVKDVTDFCNSPYRRFRSRVVHYYFKHPWTIIHVLYACLLMVIQIIQALASAKELYEGKKKEKN
ncbi:hypothetical protein LUZ60_001473 [Juncus effusus]|nr:hypothetical protein LUZ60_001473 [Juncus effusus]